MSGLYNLLFGYNPACVLVLPMLGKKADEYPRFRDCFIIEEDGKYYIDIYTRVGSCYHGQGYGEEELYKDSNFIKTFDDDFDKTYGTFRFSVPKKWEKDFNFIINGKLDKVSREYINELRKYYSNELISKFFKGESD